MPTFTDTLTTPNGTLATTPGGAAWTQRRGTFTIVGNRLTVPSSPDTSPLATINLSSGEQDVGVDAGPGDAVYFRVQDLDNWWRLRHRAVSFQQSGSRTEWQRREVFWQYNAQGIVVSTNAVFYNWYQNPTQTSPSPTSNSGFTYVLISSAVFATRQVPYTTTVQRREVVLDHCFAGSEAHSRTWELPGIPTRLRVVAQGSTIKSYTNFSDRSLGSSPDFAVPESFLSNGTLATATHAGIGCGGPTDIDNVLLRNFVAISLVSPPLAPQLVSPAPGSYVDTSDDVAITVAFAGVDPGDFMSAKSVRVRYNSLTRWLTNTGTLSATEGATTKLAPGPTSIIPGGLISLGFDVNYTAKTWGQSDLEGPLAAEQVFVSDAKPVLVLTGPPAVVDNTSRPVLTGTTTDPEGDTIDLVRARLYLADTVGEVDPSADTPIWDSGTVPVTVTAGVFSLPLGPESGLDNLTNYVVVAQVSGSATAPSDTALRAFRLDVPAPGAPVIGLAYDVSRHAVLATVGGQANQLLGDQADLTNGVTGWRAANVNTTTPIGVEGVGMKITTSGPDEMAVELTELLPTLPGVAYTDLAEFALAEGTDVGSWRIETTFFDDDGNEVAVISGPLVVEVPPFEPPDPDATYILRYASTSSYAGSLPILNATLNSATDPNLFAQLFVVTAPGQGITEVEWYYRKVGAGVWTTHRLNNTATPWTMEATSVGVPLSIFGTVADEGLWEIRARVVYADTTTEDIEARFNVLHHVDRVVPAYRIDTATAGNPFPGSQPLNGATVTGSFWPHLAWASNPDTDPAIDHVDWYWRAGSSGAWTLGRPLGTDLGAPYEFSSVPPTDPALFGPSGQYQIRAVITFVDPAL